MGLVTVGVCAHVEVHALVQASVGGCVQTTGMGEAGITVTEGGGVASGAGGSASAGVEVTNASRLSELEGRSVNVGGDLGVGPNLSGEVSYSVPEPCQVEIVGVAVSTGIGIGSSASAGIGETTVPAIF